MKKINFSFVVLSLIAFATLIIISCADNGDNLPEAPPSPVITSLSTDSGRIGTPLRIYGNFLHVPDGEPGRLYTNTSIIKFNGTLAETGRHIHQDDVGKQSMDTYVPEEATNGKVTIALNGITATAPNDFIITAPIYEPPVITGFSPSSRVIGNSVTISGNNFVPPVPVPPFRAGLTNTSIVKFNGIIAETRSVYQYDVGKQSMSAIVPEGATTGKITVTANGITASSPDDFIVYTPTYVPNVTVSTATGQGGSDVAVDADGNLYVTTNDYYKIYKITPDGTVTILLDTANDSDPGTPFGIAVDTDGNVYATIDHTIQKITPDGTISLLAGSDTYGYADGQGASAQFYFPFSIHVDNSGNVYVADLLNNAIRKITPDGVVSTLAGSGVDGDADGQGTNAQFSGPQGVAVDASGNVLVADSGNSKIRKISPNGNVTTVAGSTAGYNDALGTTAQFLVPRGIAVSANGDIYVCDSSNFVVRRISPDGNVTTVAGSSFGNLDGSGANAKFGYTLGIALDASGAIYVTQGGGMGGVRKIVIN